MPEEPDPESETITEQIRRIARTATDAAPRGIAERIPGARDRQAEQTAPPDASERSARSPVRERSKDHVSLAEEGVAMDGSEPADPVLERFDRPDTVLHAEDGDIRIDSWQPRSAGLELRGREARLLPTERSEPLSEWLYFDADRFLLEGFTFDFRTCAYPPKVVFDAPNWTMRDCAVRGGMGLPETPTGSPEELKSAGRGYSFLFVPTTGTGLVQNCAFPDGAADPDGNGNRFGFISNLDSFAGRLVYDRVYMAGWPDNTIYHHNVDGRLEIRNCFFRNTNAGIRCGGDTLVSNSVWLRDGPVPGQRWTDPESPGSMMRGVWTTGGDTEHGHSGTVRVENCDFLMRGGDDAHHGATAIRGDPAVERLEVVDCRIDWAATSHRNPIHLGFRDDQQRDCTVRLENVQLRNRTPDTAVQVENPDRFTFEHVSGTVRSDGAVSDARAIAEGLDRGDPAAVEVALPAGMTLPEWVDRP